MGSMNLDYTEGMQFVEQARSHRRVNDLPPSMKGEDTGPTPPELFIASLGSCIGVYVVGYLKAQGVDCSGIRVSMAWEDATGPSRISSITAEVQLPDGLSGEHQRMAMKAAEQCKIHNTIHIQPAVDIKLAGAPVA
jgi:putative redox protein